MRLRPASASGPAILEQEAVGGQAQAARCRSGRQARDQLGQAGPQGRLAAGQAQLVDAQRDRDAGDALDLVEGEQRSRSSQGMPSSGMQ